MPCIYVVVGGKSISYFPCNISIMTPLPPIASHPDATRNLKEGVIIFPLITKAAKKFKSNLSC